MAKFTLTIETDNEKEILGLLSSSLAPPFATGGLFDQSKPVATSLGEIATGESVSPSVVEEPKKRRGRPAKAEVADAPVEAPVGAPAEQPEAEATLEKPADDLSDFLNDEPKITKQQMLDKLMAYGKAIGEKGRSEIEALLKSFGAAKFSELDEAKYAEVCAKVDQFLTSGK